MTYGATDYGKGSAYRRVDRAKFAANYDRIFRKDTMKTLYFLNPVLRDGENLTVRRGPKWAVQVVPGEVLAIRRTPDGSEDDVLAYAKVTRIVMKRMCDITHRELRSEHHPNCHTRAGLMAAMRRAYSGFDSEEICTLLYFEKA